MIKEIDEDENENLVKSSKQWEAHETAGHRMESDDTILQKANDEITLAETSVNIKKSATKDKGKAIIQESEPPNKIKKKEMIQISLDEEIAQSDEARIAQQNLAKVEQWDDVQAQIQADEDLAQRTLKEERESLSIEKRTMKSIRKFVPMGSEGQIVDSKAGKESLKEGTRHYLKIIRVGNITEVHQFFVDMIKAFDREDLEKLWSLVKERIHHSLRSTVRDCDVERMSKVSYENAVGSLMYLMVCTRPDIVYAVSVVSRYLVNLGKNHWEAVKWILNYLRGTANVGLVYGKNHGNHVNVTGFVDSDYAKDLDKGRKNQLPVLNVVMDHNKRGCTGQGGSVSGKRKKTYGIGKNKQGGTQSQPAAIESQPSAT
nr:retrovirus-related Pol polyprotein from transposon TNT 1-94 [Tanacetum cinerariifolium]